MGKGAFGKRSARSPSATAGPRSTRADGTAVAPRSAKTRRPQQPTGTVETARQSGLRLLREGFAQGTAFPTDTLRSWLLRRFPLDASGETRHYAIIESLRQEGDPENRVAIETWLAERLAKLIDDQALEPGDSPYRLGELLFGMYQLASLLEPNPTLRAALQRAVEREPPNALHAGLPAVRFIANALSKQGVDSSFAPFWLKGLADPEGFCSRYGLRWESCWEGLVGTPVMANVARPSLVRLFQALPILAARVGLMRGDQTIEVDERTHQFGEYVRRTIAIWPTAVSDARLLLLVLWSDCPHACLLPWIAPLPKDAQGPQFRAFVKFRTTLQDAVRGAAFDADYMFRENHEVWMHSAALGVGYDATVLDASARSPTLVAAANIYYLDEIAKRHEFPITTSLIRRYFRKWSPETSKLLDQLSAA